MSNNKLEVMAEIVCKHRRICGFDGYRATPVELPEGKTVDDIEDWFIRWNTFFYFIDGVLHEAELFEPEFDRKRPSHSRLDLAEG